MAYVDFDIKLEPRAEGGYRASVSCPEAGEASCTVTAAPSLAAIAEGIRAWVGAQGARARDLEPSPSFAGPILEPRAVTDYGRELFATLLPPQLEGLYRAGLERARSQQKTLRLRLRFDDADFAVVPWEFTRDPLLEEYLCLSNETSLIRYFNVARAPASLKVSPPLRVLVVVASPSDLPELDVEREQLQLKRAIEHLTDKGAVTIKCLPDATWRDVQAEMRRGPWHVLHYVGHSGIDAGGVSVLALCGEDGASQYLRAEDLGRLVSGHSAMRLIVLNSCESGRSGTQDPFSSMAAALIRRGVPAVVAMQFAITDKAALEFSRTFYEALAEGTALDRAVGDARRSMEIVLPDTWEWGTPVLQMHSEDGVLFDVDLLSAVFPPKPAQTEAAAALRPAQPSSAAPAIERQGLLLLAKKMRTFWVNGVLDQSLFRIAQMELGMDRMAGAVVSPFASVLEESSRTSQPLPPGKPIADVFAEEGSSLLILGEPGAGKTTTMLHLLRELLDKAEAIRSEPVPAVFNLSSWSERQPLDQWLVNELSRKYQIPRKAGASWLANSSLMLLLDGLDEVTTPVRPACVDAINTFLQSGSSLGTVVCCRVKEYVALPNRLTMNTAIQLRDLAREQVLNWVRAAGPSLAALLDVLQRDSDLLLDARSPLMLSLMAQTYRDVTVESLAHEPAESAKKRRDRLMEAYVARMFRGAGIRGSV